jgi:hypothetical protein
LLSLNLARCGSNAAAIPDVQLVSVVSLAGHKGSIIDAPFAVDVP